MVAREQRCQIPYELIRIGIENALDVRPKLSIPPGTV
jgi:hypothetical protein